MCWSGSSACSCSVSRPSSRGELRAHHVKLQATAVPGCHNQARWACGALRSDSPCCSGSLRRSAGERHRVAGLGQLDRLRHQGPASEPDADRRRARRGRLIVRLARRLLVSGGRLRPARGERRRPVLVDGRKGAGPLDLRSVSLFGGEITIGAVVARSQASARPGGELRRDVRHEPHRARPVDRAVSRPSRAARGLGSRDAHPATDAGEPATPRSVAG